MYASKKDVTKIHPKVENKTNTLTKTISKYFPEAAVVTEFFGARELLDASRREKSYTLQLRFLENYISRGEDNYVVLASLKDYYDFVVDEKDNLRRYIFESNVRDYQGNVEVNKDIQQTLESDDNLDFWWFNNGITILSSKASIAGKTITLNDVQVVNGLQTTTTIYNYFDGKNVASKDNKRSILVRIIVTEDAETRDRIIKATNFQTSIPVASLRATDRIQRDIEDYFLRHEWFYDRRKNFYKNTGKPSEKIISIPYLAQAVMAIILGEPDNARARPSSLIKRDDEYTRVFSESLSLGGYLACARMMKKIDTFIRASSSEYSMQQKSNLKFHLAMLVTVKLIGKTSYKPVEVVSMLETKLNSLQEDILNQALSEIIDLVYKYANSQERLIDIDRIAKSKEFIKYLLVNVSLSQMKLE